MHYGCVDASKDIIGTSKHFQAWIEPAKVKQADNQTKPTHPPKKKRERQNMFVKIEVHSASKLILIK